MLPCFSHVLRHLSGFCFLTILSAALLYTDPGFSQGYFHGTIPVTVHNVEDGLAQSTVNHVIQDSSGLIWLVTGGGLQYFDGSGFGSFNLPEEYSSKGSGNTMQGIVETGPGQLVLSTGSSVLHFNTTTGRYSPVEQKQPQFPKLFKQFYKKKPLCWMSTDGLCLVGDLRLYPVNLKFLPGKSLPAGFMPINAVQTNEGSILISSGQGYLELKTGLHDRDTILDAFWFPVSEPCRFLSNDKDGLVYLLSAGIIFSVGGKGKLKEIINTGITESDYLFIDRLNNYWLSDISHKRVYRISKGKTEEIKFIAREGKHSDTIHPAVRTIFEDKRGNLWFGTDGNGLLSYYTGQLIFDHSAIGFTRCISFFEGEIWAGTFKNGLWRLPLDLSSKRRVNQGILTNELYFLDLFPEPSGRIWAATSKGVYILNKNGSVVFYYPFETLAAKFLSLPGNKILLSTYEELYSCETGSKPGLTFIRNQTQIKQVIAYRGFYWVGNHFGLYRKDTAAGLIASLNFNVKDRLTPVPVYSILPVDGIIWAGTEHGIEFYSSGGEKKQVPGYLGELDHEIIYALLPDTQNRIWFSSNKGSGCIPASRDRIIRFSTRNNLQSSEFNFNADLSDREGRIFFGGINGINGLNTRSFIYPNTSPGVRLISLNISDTAYTLGIPPEDLTVNIHWRSPHVGGTVFTPDYQPSGTAEFSFFLEGYQDRWNQPSGNPGFSYRNLSPGTYHLWVRTIDSFKNQGKARCLLTITIKPPIWKTWWFIILSALTGTMIIILTFRKVQEVKYRNLLKDLEQRNAIDRERLRISQDMHDEIGSSLTQVAILSEIVKKQKDNPEEMMKLVDRISSISGSVVDDMGDIIWAMNPGNDNLSSFTSYLRQHTSEYLETARIDADFFFPGDCPSLPMTSEQRRNVFLVVKEALNNIVKHSGASKAIVSLALNGTILEISIDDNGKGFDIERSLEAGNGLTGMKKRIELLGGSYSITSGHGNGTQITFSVKLSESSGRNKNNTKV